MHQDLKPVFRYGFGLLGLAAFFLLTAFLLWPYAKLQALFSLFNSQKESLLPWNGFTGTYGFSENTYWLAVLTYALVAIISFYLFFRLRKSGTASLARSLFVPFRFFSFKLKTVWQSLPLSEKWIVSVTLALLVLVRLYFLFTVRIGGDEMASFIYFVSKGLPGVLFYYPLPNNHIFYNLLCLPLRPFFEDPYWIVELPTFFISLVGTVIIYLAFRSVLPFVVVFFGTAAFCFSQHALYFSVHGRGYFLLSLCTALAALAIYKISEWRDENYYWLVFLFCSVAGFYTIPIFLYPFAITGIYGALVFCYNHNWQAFKNLIIAGFFTGVITLLLYSPVLLASGRNLLFGNAYVVSDPFEDFYARFSSYLIYNQGSVLGQESYGFYLWLLGFAGISVLLLFHARLKKMLPETGIKPAFLFLLWCNLLLPWIFVLVQRVRPPERVLFFKAFFDFLAVGIVFYVIGFLIFRRSPRLLLTGFLLFIAGFGSYQVHKAYRNEQSPIIDKGFDKRLQAIYNSGATTVFGNFTTYTAYLRYEFFKHNAPFYLLREHQFNPAHLYEVLILDNRKTDPPQLNLDNYRLMYENHYVRIFYANDFLEKKKARNLNLE